MDILLAHVAKPKTMAAEPILMLLGVPGSGHVYEPWSKLLMRGLYRVLLKGY